MGHREQLGQKMGLPKRVDYYQLAHQKHEYLGAGEDEGSALTGVIGAIIGLFDGFHFQSGGDSDCFMSLTGSLTSYENFGYILSKAYLPWYWSELVINIQDISATGSGFFTDCKLDKLFTTLTTMFSLEGLIELGSRAVGQFPTYISMFNTFGDPEATSMEC